MLLQFSGQLGCPMKVYSPFLSVQLCSLHLSFLISVFTCKQYLRMGWVVAKKQRVRCSGLMGRCGNRQALPDCRSAWEKQVSLH